MRWIAGFFGGLIIALIILAIGFYSMEATAELFNSGDLQNDSILAFFSAVAVAVIAGIIGWIVIAWRLGKADTRWTTGFFGGLIITVIIYFIGRYFVGNDLLSAIFSSIVVPVIAGIIGWILIAQLLGKKEAAEDSS